MCGDYYPENEKFISLDERIEKLEIQADQILCLLTQIVDFLHTPTKRGVYHENGYDFVTADYDDQLPINSLPPQDS